MEKEFPPRRGVTLLELLTVVAVAAVVLGLAVPAFSRFIVATQVQAATSLLLSSLHYARSEAIKRRVNVTLCKSSNGATCTTGGGWDAGWLVYANSGNLFEIDGNDVVLRRFHPDFSQITISGNSVLADYVMYTPLGVTRRTTGALLQGTIRLCPRGSTVKGRAIVISRTGRPRVRPDGCGSS